MSNVIWTPQPRQEEFMSRPEYEVLYGGAAGGGKTDALLAEALRQVHIPNYRALLIRETYPQLEAMITRSRQLYSVAYPKAVYHKTDKCWKFPSGAMIFFGYMQYEDDKYNYQGSVYDFIGVDELTHFSQTQYEYLISRNRPMGPGTICYIRATANPDGKGMGWVKARFVTPAPPNTTIWASQEIMTPEGKKTVRRSRRFVPSTVFDNQELLKNDPSYLANLAMMPEAQRNALLYGSWDSFTGQVFTEWRNDPAHYQDRLWTHVIEPFDIPDNWKVVRGFDWGYNKPFSVGWYAADKFGKIYRIKEYYGCTATPNEGIRLEDHELAKNIYEFEHTDPTLKRFKITGIADPAIWQKDGGESIAEVFEKHRVYFEKGDNTRIPGKMQFHYRLAFDSNGDCMFQVFNNCKEFIRTFPALVYSEKKPEDVDTDQEDHSYDEGRYVMMSNPIAPRENVLKRIPMDDPLNLYKDRQKKVVNYYNI